MCAKKASAKKPKAAKKPTKTEQLQEAAELLERIEKAEKECETALLEWDRRRAAAKSAKEVYGNAVEQLRKLCRARSEEHPLFDPPKDKKTAAEDKPADQPLLDAAEKHADAKPAGTDTEWKNLSLAVAGFNEKQTDALEAADIRTLGELQDAMNRHGLYWAKNVGVSGRLRQKIEDVFNEYLMRFAGKQAA